MKNKISGVSIIALIITIVITIILLAVVINDGEDKIINARLVTFKYDISSITNEIESYLIMNPGQYPAFTDGSTNYIVYSISSIPTLLEAITKENHQSDTFYIIDLNKLKIDNKEIGFGKTKDDYYIFGINSKSLYYAKGIEIDSTIYHTLKKWNRNSITIS